MLISVLGALAGTAVDMTDPQTSFAAILPKWFYPVFLLVIIVSSITPITFSQLIAQDWRCRPLESRLDAR